MARTNQGIFNKVLREYEELLSTYDNVVDLYEECDYIDFIVDCGHTTGQLYDDIGVFVQKLRGILEATKFESEENKEKYEDMVEKLISIQNDVEERFYGVIKAIYSSGGLRDIEIQTIDRYGIWSKRHNHGL